MYEQNSEDEYCWVGTSLNFSLVKGFTERTDRVMEDSFTHTYLCINSPTMTHRPLMANFQCKSAVSIR